MYIAPAKSSWKIKLGDFKSNLKTCVSSDQWKKLCKDFECNLRDIFIWK